MQPAPSCIAFSEAEHGSDLAAVETRGDIVGDDVCVSGTKIWLADADRAIAALVLCVTEPAQPRYRNLSCVLVPLHDNNVEVRAMSDMAGRTEYYEATFDGARAPLANILGGRGNGWRVALSTLASARAAGRDDAQLDSELRELVETARRYGRDRDPLVRQELAWAYTRMRVLQLNHHPEVRSLLWGEYRQRLGDIAVEIIGPDALVRPEGEAYATTPWQHTLLASPGQVVANGTPEVQRTLLAEQVLGLPS